MAVNTEKKTVDNKTEKKSFPVRVGKWFAALPGRIYKAFYNMFHELKKVTWPTKSGLINYSLVVLAFLVVMGVIIYVFDLGAGWLVKLITG